MLYIIIFERSSQTFQKDFILNYVCLCLGVEGGVGWGNVYPRPDALKLEFPARAMSS